MARELDDVKATKLISRLKAYQEAVAQHLALLKMTPTTREEERALESLVDEERLKIRVLKDRCDRALRDEWSDSEE
jgi:hypothetical protein